MAELQPQEDPRLTQVIAQSYAPKTMRQAVLSDTLEPFQWEDWYRQIEPAVLERWPHIDPLVRACIISMAESLATLRDVDLRGDDN